MRIAIHAFDGITMFHLATPLMVFGEVGRLALAADWSAVVWSDTSEGVRTQEGLSIGDVSGPEVLDSADLVVFPSWSADLPIATAVLQQSIRAAHQRGATIVGLCLGAFPLAHSGLLDGRTAVTHWARAADLAAGRPAVVVDPSALYIDHGDVLTSAGTASTLDACLHLVRTRLGAAAATTLARHLVVAPHREGNQAQYVPQPVLARPTTDSIGSAMEWALANLDRSLTVDELAAHVHMSRRTFSRHFRAVVGASPAGWVRTQRLDAARVLLETTSASVADIASATGYDNAVTFRQGFQDAYTTTPTSYRRRFREPLSHLA
ncbi:MAG: helix-turn-helix domain-containing protein [Nakamurella sp.]